MRLTILLAGLALAAAVGTTNGQTNRGACDRTCLEGFVDQYLDAMGKHDPKSLPLARNVRFTENGQHLELGDGLWNSFAGKGTYRLFVDDPERGEVAFMGTIREESRNPAEPSPAAIAMRLKIQNRQIAEAETLVIRQERAAQNLEKLGKPNQVFLEEVPEAERLSREELIKTANEYFSGMQLNDGKGVYPFTDDCNRIENGSQTTNVPTPAGQKRPDPATATGYSAQWGCKEQFQSGLLHFVTRIRDRRYVAVDRERGLVFSFAFFDHAAGKTRTFQTPSGRTVTAGPTQPWTWEIAEMFKVIRDPRDGQPKLRQIEALLDRAPYGMNSGWSSWEDGMSDRAREVK
ncbi:MAG TPA: hypothetical protein VKV17_04660 [Bryobacteraceae bacterium]|nr:hypothetical protein [Bryobacteraceae bacterium]